jgi:hypothetical protein
MDYRETFQQQRLSFFAELRCILVTNKVKIITSKKSERKISQ